MQINFERLPTLNNFLHRVKAYLNKRPRMGTCTHPPFPTVTWCYSQCYVLSGLNFKATGWLSCRLLFVQLFAAKALSYCKHDVDALSLLNVETLKKVPNHLLGRLVRCSTLRPVLKHFMYSLGMGIFKHTRCSFGDEGWIGLPEDITEDCQ